MFSTRKSLLAVAMTGAFALAAAPAHAAVMASSVVNMTNFTISGSDGNVLDFSDDFGFLTFTSSADMSGSLTGSAPFDFSSAAAPIDFPATCTGSGCGALGLVDNAFAKFVAPPVGNYAAADQVEFGAPITGLVGFDAPATVANASYTGLTTISGAGSANSNNNLNSSFVFILNQDQGITFDFMVDAYLQAFVSGDENFPGFATASYQMDFSILNLSTGATVWSYSPDLFGDGIKTLSLNAPLPFDVETARDTGGASAFSSTTAMLSAGDLYQLSARIQTKTDAARIPEPGMLALLGMGLFGLGVIRRLRSRA